MKLFFEKSFASGKIPDIYKRQVIIPLHKKGTKTAPENYRPVSLTPHEIKIMERILRKIFTDHLEQNNLINVHQHGFRKNRSCCTQLISHVHHILSNAVVGNETDCLYLDYSKAFDKVDHRLLLMKLNMYGISNKYLDWIKNFLQNRTLTVFLNGVYSHSAPVKSGVPQGSVLAPLFFIIVTNDLPQNITNLGSHILTFADDTKVASKVSSIYDVNLLQKDIESVLQWSTSNNMELNCSKFELLNHNFSQDNVGITLLKELPFFNTFNSYKTLLLFQVNMFVI